MRYLVLATDYDETLATDGRVPDTTIAALEKLRGSGRKLVLVTGRELEDLLTVLHVPQLFDRIVAENGAMVYHPVTREVKTLAEKPPAAFVAALKKRKVHPLAVGHVIVATWKPQETAVLSAIRDLGLDLQVIFNKDAVMVLPAGVNKASGLAAALKELELSFHEVVGIGDAENDHVFLSMCECAVAVRNALPMVKERADLVTVADHGRGVEKLIERLLENDLEDVHIASKRHHLPLGHRDTGEEIRIAPYGSNVLIAGPSSSGKSTIAKSLLERLEERHYQFCVVDPEGDYASLEGAVTIGSSKRGPTIEEILQLLQKPDSDVVVNLVGLPIADRPQFFLALLPRLQEMRSRVGRPHWIVVDETHHLLPATWTPALSALPQQLERMVFITVHPEQIAAPALAAVNIVLAVGADPDKTIAHFCQAAQLTPPPRSAIGSPREGTSVFLWARGKDTAPYRVTVVPTRAEHQRHLRKYAEGELPPERSFYFRGPEGKLNLRAQNLMLFNQMAAGVDDATWLHHLKQGDYSKWFRAGLHDEALAAEAEKIEKSPHAPAMQTRDLIKQLIERHYTLPASAPVPIPGTNAERKSKK